MTRYKYKRIFFRKIKSKMTIHTFDTKQKCTFDTPIMSSLPATAENRFGASLDLINQFREKLLTATRNSQLIRARWEIEWQTEEQSSKANHFLRECLANKEIINHVSTRTELRPIPAQWEHLMKKLQKSKVFHPYIKLAYGKFSQVIIIVKHINY